MSASQKIDKIVQIDTFTYVLADNIREHVSSVYELLRKRFSDTSAPEHDECQIGRSRDNGFMIGMSLQWLALGSVRFAEGDEIAIMFFASFTDVCVECILVDTAVFPGDTGKRL